MSAPDLIVCDIGGTHTRFGLAHGDLQTGFQIENFAKLRGDDFDTFHAALRSYLATLSGSKPRHISMAFAGPVTNGTAALTNRPWSVSEVQIAKTFDFDGVRLFNDFDAMARSIPLLGEDDFDSIRPGVAQSGAPILVAGPGTGFGVATLIQSSGNWQVLSGEGGHVAFAPRSETERQLLEIIQSRQSFVSLEDVASGRGLPILHQAVCERHGTSYSPRSPQDIRHLAEKNDAVALEVCTVRSAIIMSALADMVLITGARGGVVLAGGVSERLADYLMKPQAIERFSGHGKISPYVADVPIKLLKNPVAPLLGAAALYKDKL